MDRVDRVLKKGAWDGQSQDYVVLDYDYRHRRRIALTTAKGEGFLLDLADVPDLRAGDGLRLTSGAVIAVAAADESLMEITCGDAITLARIAWHLGNRHLPTEIGARRIRIRADHVIGEMVAGLGAAVRTIEAPFDPEGGAYSGAARGRHEHSHDHGHDHMHDHGHHHHHG